MVKFHKMHGLGNDFVIFDAREQAINLTNEQVIRICDRNLGVGCDQLIIIQKHDKVDAEMIIYNIDGSQAGACGNATRCVAKLLGEGEKKILISDRIIETKQIAENMFSINMGVPQMKRIEAFDVGGFVIKKALEVTLGNHHIVIFDEFNIQERAEIGRALQSHMKFPDGINVNFAKVQSREAVELQTWERGAGFTQACGSGACATQVAANILGYTDASAIVRQSGGELKISYTDNSVYMEGPAAYVFSGELEV